jgi:hypothetical protein
MTVTHLPGLEIPARAEKAKRKRAEADRPTAQDFVWAMTPHVCGVCFGRVLERRLGNSEVRREFRCACCGNSATAHEDAPHPPNCACSIRVGKRDAGIRCQANDKVRPAQPHEFIAREPG